MRGEVFHQDTRVGELDFRYAGRVNVFEADFTVPDVAKDYEVLDVRVTAAQAPAGNFGYQRRTYKLTP